MRAKIPYLGIRQKKVFDNIMSQIADSVQKEEDEFACSTTGNVAERNAPGGSECDEENEHNSRYREKEYWDKRFTKEDKYEWLCTYNDVKDYIVRDICVHDKILVLGCGNSTFSADLHDAGFHNVTSVDFSPNVIEAMKKKYNDSHPSLEWQVGDVRQLDGFSGESFDIVIDKACLDALVCDEGDPWSPNERTKNDMYATLKCVSRVLKRNGVSNANHRKFISIGFQQPHFRKRYLINDHVKFGWEDNVETFPINVGLGYFYMVCIPKCREI